MIKKFQFGTRDIKDFDKLILELNKINKDAWKFSRPSRDESGDTIIEVDDNSNFYDAFLALKLSLSFP